MQKVRGLALGLWGITTLVACGGGSGGGPISIEKFIVDASRETCARLVTCGEFPDRPSCEAAVSIPGDPEAATLVAAIERGTMVLHPERWEECFAGMRPACTVGTDQPDVCYLVFEGKVAQGGACVATMECADRALCEGIDGCGLTCCVGVCGPPGEYLAPLGAGCSTDVWPACTRGAFCDGSTCVPRVPVGAACDAFEACQPPGQCDFREGTDGICVVPGAEGATCDPQATYPCLRSDNVCNQGTLTCTKRKLPGEPCSLSPDSCVSYARCGQGTCRSVLVGDPCDDTSLGATTCVSGLSCVSNVCSHPPAQAACVP